MLKVPARARLLLLLLIVFSAAFAVAVPRQASCDAAGCTFFANKIPTFMGCYPQWDVNCYDCLYHYQSSGFWHCWESPDGETRICEPGIDTPPD